MTGFPWPTKPRPTTDEAPSVEALHVRRKEVTFTREGFPNEARGVCSCGWIGRRHEAVRAPIGHDPVDRDLATHITEMRGAA